MSAGSSSPDLSIYLSSLNGVDTVLRYAEACQHAGGRAVVCVEAHAADAAAEVVDGSGVDVDALPPLDRGPRRTSALVRDYGSSLVMGDNRANAETSLPQSGWKRGLVRSARLAPGKPGAPSINRLLRRTLGSRFPVTFPSRHVLVISFPLVPERLLHPDLVVDTVVDSWDHPVRRAAGYATRLAVAWNDDLGRDWQHYQGAAETLIGPPVKLEYALEAPVEHSEPIKTLLYPVATSSHYPEWFRDELALIHALSGAADKAGWRVLVKPKPESTPAELAGVLVAHDNVDLGRFHDSFGTLDYRLGPEYNRNRLDELRQADVVVNALTTFGLDAACASAPLIQLDLRACRSLPTLSGVAANHHLQAHLYRLASPALLRPGSLEELTRLVADRLLHEPAAASTASSAALRAWASPGLGSDLTPVMARVLAG